MAAKSKVVPSFREAVADIPDGSTIAFGGFAMPGTPYNLIKALLEQGAKRLTLVGNTTGGAQQPAAARTQSNPGYDTLTAPDGRVIFIGDHVSHIVAWQEGAAVSALRGVKLLSEQVKAARLASTSDSVSA